jgi:hypothetical protein
LILPLCAPLGSPKSLGQERARFSAAAGTFFV